MKKTRLFFGILVVALIGLVFTACEDDEKAGPSITFAGGNYIDSDATVAPGATIAFSWTAQKGDANLATITIDRDGVALTGWNALDIPNNVNDIYIDEAEFTAPLNEGSYVYTITVTDNNDLSAIQSFTITVEGAGDPVSEFTAVLLGAQSNNSAGSTASLTTGVVYSISGGEAASNSDEVDIVYYYGTRLAALYSPSQSDIQAVSTYNITSWTNKNDTKLGVSSLSASEFDDVTHVPDLESAGTPTLDVVPELEVNDVIVFETDSGKKGVFKVTAVVPDNNGSITIDIKVEP